MKNIIICGDCGSRKLTRSVISACTKNGGAFVIDGGSIYQTESNPDFCIVTACTLTDISCKGIIVFGKALCQISPNIDICNMIPIADTENTDALRLLQNQNCRNVITCSMSSKSTISISGMEGSKKLVSLQRTLTRLDGERTEPYEFNALLSEEIPIYPLLAACAVMLLSDTLNHEEYRI